MEQNNKIISVCNCCCGLDAEEAEEVAGLDQVEMTLTLARKVKTVRDAAKGCEICNLLLRILQFFGAGNGRDDPVNMKILLPVGAGNAQIIFMANGTQSVAQLYSSTSSEGIWKTILPLPDTCTNQLSPQGKGFINTCMRTCLQSHQLCRGLSISDEKYPRRLLFVGQAPNYTLHLVDTTGCSPGPYAALSYSWGGAVTTKTKTTNTDDMKKAIYIHTLQATIIDAIVLTRELGIEYLWVDALCIVQDSKEDWERESTKMASLYANAMITIASVSSKSAAQPFLRPENSAASTEHRKRVFTHAVGTTNIIKARLIEQSGIHWRWQDDSEERLPKEPWAQRGWTLQEQVLSSRLLMLSSTEMQWVCKEAETCECLSTLNRRRQFGRTPLAQIRDANEAFQFWHKLVENYTVRNLSHNSDKLPAISGIAEVIQQKTNSRYIAGLWSGNIDLDLLWRKTGGDDDVDHNCGGGAEAAGGGSGDSMAPSFSWASVDGEVDYYCFRNGRLPYRKTTTVVSMETVPSLQAPLGRVSGGTLVVRGPLVPCMIGKYSESGGYAAAWVDGRRLGLTTDAKLGYTVKSDGDRTDRYACRKTRVVETGVTAVVPAGEESEDVHTLKPGLKCWLLKLGEFEPRHYKTGEWGAEIMVLGMSPSYPGCYQRVGFVSDIVRGFGGIFKEESVTTITLV